MNESGGFLTIRILQTGSKKPALQEEALAIFTAAIQGCIHIEPEWIPRAGRLLSRKVDKDDWEIPLGFFLRLNASWGHTQ